MAGTECELLSRIKSQKLQYFKQVMRISHDSIEANVMTSLVKGARNRKRPRICWIDNYRRSIYDLARRKLVCYASHEVMVGT